MHVLAVVGMILMVIGGLWLLVEAFKASVLWGLGCLFVPIVSLFFVATHWSESKTPFLLQLAGVVLLVIGSPKSQ